MRRLVLLIMAMATMASHMHSQKREVKVDYVRSADFGKFRTFAWKNGHALGKDAILPMELLDAHVRTAVTRELTARGLKEVSSNPDAFITYFVGLDAKSSAASFRQYDHFGNTGYQAAEAFDKNWDRMMVQTYRKGILLIDFVDAAGNSLVWRAHCEETAGDPGALQSRIDAAARIAFRDFPPKTRK